MPLGLYNVTTVTMSNITDITNISSFPELLINVNNMIYAGWLFFIILIVLWFILFISAQKVKDQPMNNLMYAGAAVTFLSFLLRGVIIVQEGMVKGLITDTQLWIFPLVTIIIAIIKWSGKE